MHVPEFLQPVRELFFEAGHQLRIIDKLRTGLGVESAVVQAIRQISKSEELEMTNICQKCNDAWALCRTEFGHVGVSSWFADGGNQSAFLPFQHNALHEVCLLFAKIDSECLNVAKVVDAMNRAAQERRNEVQHILTTAREIRRVEKKITDAKALLSFQERAVAIERQRRESIQRFLQQKTEKQKLLSEQKAAMKEASARKTVERSKVQPDNLQTASPDCLPRNCIWSTKC